MDPRLVALRIPAGWYVLTHSLFELDAEVENGKLLHPAYFWQDMLSIRQMQPTGGSPTLGPYCVDVGWYPDGAANGRFRMVLLYEDWEHILHSVESRDWRVIRDIVDRTLEAVNRSQTSEEVVRRLTQP